VHIALDAMGGDRGTEEIVSGAIQAVCRLGYYVTLIGDQAQIEKALKVQLAALKNCDAVEEHTFTGDVRDRISTIHTSQVVEMGESPMDAIRKKKDSSILVAFKQLNEKHVDAVVSAGNSGATLAAALKTIGRIKGISRPGIAGIFPTLKKPLVIMDVGANVDCRANHLYQFAIMASAFSKLLFDIEKPRVGLLSIGEEGGKGNALVKNTHELLLSSGMNYIGNVEGRDTFQGDVDVIVCDGFVGNVCLKLSEGLADAMVAMLREEFRKNLKSKVGYLLTRKAYANLKKRTDYAEYGGAPLLGFNGSAIICHGRSNSRAIMNAIKVAAELARNNMNDHISNLLAKDQTLSANLSNIA